MSATSRRKAHPPPERTIEDWHRSHVQAYCDCIYTSRSVYGGWCCNRKCPCHALPEPPPLPWGHSLNQQETG